jgi:hypothetical protein
MLQRVRGAPDVDYATAAMSHESTDVSGAADDDDNDSTAAAATIDEARLIELAQAEREGKLSLDMLSLSEQKLFMRAAAGGALSRYNCTTPMIISLYQS